MNQAVTITPKISRILEEACRLKRQDTLAILETALFEYLRRQQRWQKIRKWGFETAKKMNLSRMAQTEKIIDEIRH